jgi:hypothetical protein
MRGRTCGKAELPGAGIAAAALGPPSIAATRAFTPPSLSVIAAKAMTSRNHAQEVLWLGS